VSCLLKSHRLFAMIYSASEIRVKLGSEQTGDFQVEMALKQSGLFVCMMVICLAMMCASLIPEVA
jgi:hypothetical protein